MFFAPLNQQYARWDFFVNTLHITKRFAILTASNNSKQQLWIRIGLINKLSRSFASNNSQHTPIGQVQELKQKTTAKALKRL